MIKCNECGREFESEHSLEQHKNSKHYRPEQKQEPKIRKKHIIYLVLLLAVAGIAYGTYHYVTSPGKYDSFAQCLSEKGAKFYGAFWCQHCATQKSMFGKSMKYVNYIECSTPDRSGQTQVCIDAGIQSYPTWEFPDGSKETGSKELSYLSLKSGCAL